MSESPKPLSLADTVLLGLLQRLGIELHLRDASRNLANLPAGLSVTGTCIVEDLAALDYDGQDGVDWPTYWDIEVFWVMEQLLVKSVTGDKILGTLQDHVSSGGSDESGPGLVWKINEIEPGLLNELPLVRRLLLLRFILTGCAANPSRLGYIWRPVVRVLPESQLPPEVEFAALQGRARRERYLVSISNPMKFKDEISATLHSVEETIQAVMASDSL